MSVVMFWNTYIIAQKKENSTTQDGTILDQEYYITKKGFLKDFESIKESHKREYLISSIIIA